MRKEYEITSGQDSVWETMGVGICFEPKRTPTGDRLDAAIEWLLSGKGNMVEGKDRFDKEPEGDYSGLKLVKGSMTEDNSYQVNSPVDRNQELANEAREERRRIQEDPDYARRLSEQSDTYPTAGSGALSTARQSETAQERAARLGLEVREAPMPEPAPKKLGLWDRFKNLTTGQKVATGVVVGTTVAGVVAGGAALQGGEQQQPTATNKPIEEPTSNPVANPTEIPSMPTTEPTLWVQTQAPTEVELSYEQKLGQAPVSISVSESFGFDDARVSLPESVKASRDLALLYKAGQLEPYPGSPSEVRQRIAALGEAGADFGGVDPTKEIKINVVDLNTEGSNYSLEVTRGTNANVPIIAVGVSVNPDGSVEYIIGVNPNNMMELVRGDFERDRVLEFAINAGIRSASQFLAIGKEAEFGRLQGEERNKAVEYVDFIGGSESYQTLGIGSNDGTNIRTVVDIIGTGK